MKRYILQEGSAVVRSDRGDWVRYADALAQQCPQDSQEAFLAFLARRGVAKFHSLYGAVAREIEELEMECAKLREFAADMSQVAIHPVSTRPASPALDRLKEEIERCPHSNECKANCHRLNRVAGKDYTCTCFKSRALRIIEELKHE